MTGPDYILDLSGNRRGAAAPDTSAARAVEAHEKHRQSSALAGRPWLAIHWRCCETYSRIYRKADGSAYDGRCPRCGKPLRVPVGEGGSSSRFFEAF